MGYSNLKTLGLQVQKRLLNNLHVLLEEYDYRSLEFWVEKIIASGQFRVISEEENTLYCVDNENDLISINYPAIIDLEGENTHRNTTVYRTIQFKECIQCIAWSEFTGPRESLNPILKW